MCCSRGCSGQEWPNAEHPRRSQPKPPDGRLRSCPPACGLPLDFAASATRRPRQSPSGGMAPVHICELLIRTLYALRSVMKCIPFSWTVQVSASEQTAVQAKVEYKAQMGEAIGEVYSALWQEVAWIHTKWAQYVELFGTSAERIDLLNSAAPSMFRTVQDSLWEDVLLHLARLTDPPKSSGRRNLSMRHLVALLEGSQIATAVASNETAALSASEFARDWRHRRLAHRSLDLALGQSVEPLAPASRADVKKALSAVEELLNTVSRHYLDSSTRFELGSGGADAVSLLHLLRDGVHFREDRRARIPRGDATLDDLRPEPL